MKKQHKMRDYVLNKSIKTGDIRLNGISGHPCLVVDDPIRIYPIIGISHSKTYNGKPNIYVSNNLYCHSDVSFSSKNKLLYLSKNKLLPKEFIDEMIKRVKSNSIKYKQDINISKIK